MNAKVLVIGYGNELRRDDGAGPAVARAVARGGEEGVRAVAVPQLMPELAEAVAGAGRVIFVDARVGTEGGVRVQPVSPAVGSAAWGHTSDPGWLLALAEAVFDTAPEAWLVTVSAADFAFGVGLSETARAALAEATEQVRQLAAGPGRAAPLPWRERSTSADRSAQREEAVLSHE
jgi:hydrogenase maturation protease